MPAARLTCHRKREDSSNETYKHHCYGGSGNPHSRDHLRSISASGSARAGLFGICHCTAKSGAVSAAPQLYSGCGARRQHGAGSDDFGAAEHDRRAA
jgi:hypothetical protein